MGELKKFDNLIKFPTLKDLTLSSSSSENFEEESKFSEIPDTNLTENADFLVVDDNMHNLFTLKAILKNMFKKTKVDFAFNGKEAV